MASDNDQSVILQQYADGPEVLATAIAGLDDSKLDAPRPDGGWSIRQIVHHIVDGDDVWKWCIKAAIGNDGAEFSLEWYGAQTQDEWADRWEYSMRSVDVSLSLFIANRKHVLQLLEHIPDSWERAVELRMPDGNIRTLTVGDSVKIQAEHVTHHVQQITAILGS
jgi:uncharacterized damage-inducible protein DinB